MTAKENERWVAGWGWGAVGWGGGGVFWENPLSWVQVYVGAIKRWKPEVFWFCGALTGPKLLAGIEGEFCALTPPTKLTAGPLGGIWPSKLQQASMFGAWVAMGTLIRLPSHPRTAGALTSPKTLLRVGLEEVLVNHVVVGFLQGTRLAFRMLFGRSTAALLARPLSASAPWSWWRNCGRRATSSC